MEERGWVQRSDHPSDRRVYVVTLTADGRRLWQKVLPEYVAAVRRVTANVPAADLRRAQGILQKLETATREWGKTHEA